VDRNLAPIETLDLASVDVNADDMVTRIRETGTGNKAHVTGAEYRDTHLSF